MKTITKVMEMTRRAHHEQSICSMSELHPYSLEDVASPDVLNRWSKYNLKAPSQIIPGTNVTCILECPRHGEYITAANDITTGTEMCPQCWKQKHSIAVVKEAEERQKTRGRGRPTQEQKDREYHLVACHWCGHEEYWREIDLSAQVFCRNCRGMVRPTGRDFMGKKEYVPGVCFAPYHNGDIVEGLVHQLSKRFIVWQCDENPTHRFRLQTQELMRLGCCPICKVERDRKRGNQFREAKRAEQGKSNATRKASARKASAGKSWTPAS